MKEIKNTKKKIELIVRFFMLCPIKGKVVLCDNLDSFFILNLLISAIM